MSHHGREYEDDRTTCGSECTDNAVQKRDAVRFLRRVVNGEFRTLAEIIDGADAWLSVRGHGSRAERAAQAARERRASELDAEIERLKAERAKL